MNIEEVKRQVVSREIKFRAWHENTEKMYYNIESMYESDPHGFFGESKNSPPFFCFGECLDNQYASVMQYIGFKDKKGKEIFEGDILDTNSDVPIGYVTRSLYGDYMVQKESMTRSLSEIFEIEIIGNIFENPDLLLKKQCI